MALGDKGEVEQVFVRMLLIFYLQNYPAWTSGGTDIWVHTGSTLHLMEPVWASEKAVPFVMLKDVIHGLASGDLAGYQPSLASCSWKNTSWWCPPCTASFPLYVRDSIGLGLLVSLTKDLLLQCLGETWRQTVFAWLWVGSGLFDQKSPPHL